MKHPISTVIAFLAGFALAVLILAMARLNRPLTLDASEAVEALLVAIEGTVAEEAQSRTDVLYVRSEFDSMLVQRLRRVHPSINFREWADRPPDIDCKSSDAGRIPLAPCERPDFISAGVSDSPLWRTFLIRTGRPNGGCDRAVVNAFNRWRIVSERCFVI